MSREWTYTLYAAASREMPQHWFQETRGYGVFKPNRGFRDTHKINMIVGWYRYLYVVASHICTAWRWAGGTRSLVKQVGLVGGPLSRWPRTGSAGGVPSRTARTGSADRLLGSAVLLSRDGGSLPRPASAGTAAHDGRMRSSAGVLTIIVIIVNLASMLPPPHGPHGPKCPP